MRIKLLLIFMLIISMESTAKQIKPTTTDIIQDYVRQGDISIFEKKNEIFKNFITKHLNDTNIVKFPDFFLYRMGVNENRSNYNKYIPLLISIIDYPRRQYSSIKNDAKQFEIEDSSNFSSLGTYLGNGRYVPITNTNIIISKNLQHLQKILNSYATREELIGYSSEIQKRVSNVRWSGVQYFSVKDSITLLSFTTLDSTSRNYLIKEAKKLKLPDWVISRLSGTFDWENYMHKREELFELESQLEKLYK